MNIRDFDLIVISDCTKPVPINKLCINNIPNNIADYQVSNTRFISFKLIYGDVALDIELNNNNYNFYVVDNIFDKSFFFLGLEINSMYISLSLIINYTLSLMWCVACTHTHTYGVLFNYN
jgi:hypothetical protein